MKHLKQFNESWEDDFEIPEEAELLKVFSEKGWNFVGKSVEFFTGFPKQEIAGKIGTIKSVKDEVATIEVDGENYSIPFTQLGTRYNDYNLSKIIK